MPETSNLRLPLIPDNYTGNYAEMLREAMGKIDDAFAIPSSYPTEYLPTITADGAAPSITYAYQKGFTLRAGRRVYVEGEVGFSARSGGSGCISLVLPYVSLNAAGYYPALSIGQIIGYSPALPNTKNVVWRGAPNSNKAHLICSDFAAATDDVIGALGNSFYCRFFGVYFIEEP